MEHYLSRALRCALILSCLSPLPVRAEEDAIIVTGSRLPREKAEEGTGPVRRIDAADLSRSGQDNLADVLRRDPAFAAGFGPGNSNMRGAGNGLNLLDLHGLGTARTLVLVNGRRMVAGLGGASAVDINMIPVDLIERVEILTGGASSVYGADAVAGVVNIVTDRRPEGLRLDAQSGISDRGDMPRQRIGLTAGTDIAEGRGHIWLHGSHAHDGGLLSSARPWSAQDAAGASIFTPQGAFNLDGTIYGIGFDPAKGLVFNDYDGASLQKGIPLGQGYDRNAFRRISVPVDRLLLNAGLDFELGSSVSFHLEGQYGETRSSARIEPYAAAGGDPARDGAGAIEVPGGIALDNPFIPAPIAAEVATRNGDSDPANDVAFIAFRRRLGDVFDRSNHNRRRLWRGVAELSGGGTGTSWTLSYVYGRTMDRTAADTISRTRLVSALDAVSLNGSIVCRDPVARVTGCQPLNIFGADSASPGAIGWLRGGGGLQTVLDSRVEQHVLTGTLTTMPFRLPAGPARLVMGGEYRRESSIEDWDADTNAGRTLAAQADDARGAYAVGSAFTELAMPLLRGLEVEGAARIDRYSTVGTVVNWRAGSRWTPVRGLTLRASYGASSRAPTIAELYTARKETFPGTATLDPCTGVTTTRNGPLDAACRSIAGIAAAISGGGSFGYTMAEVEAIGGFNGGNPALREEQVRSLSMGLTLAPVFLPGLQMTLDYYRISLTGAIAAQPRSETVRACLADPASMACAGLVQRLANGKLARVDAVLINGGAIRHAGIDMGIDYRLSFGADADMRIGGRWTHLLEHRRQAYAAAPLVDELGQLQDADQMRLGSGYRDRFVVDAMLRRSGASLSWTMRYLGPILDTKDGMVARAINAVPAIAYHDVQMRMALSGTARREIWLGIANLFDRAPPSLPNGLAASGLLGVETAQDYDSIGRAFHAGLTMTF